jgi:hypothetical protein
LKFNIEIFLDPQNYTVENPSSLIIENCNFRKMNRRHLIDFKDVPKHDGVETTNTHFSL